MKKIARITTALTLALICPSFMDGMIWAAKFYAHFWVGVGQRML